MKKFYHFLRSAAFLLGCFLINFNITTAQNITMKPAITGLNQPIQVVNAGDGSNKVYIVEKGGSIQVFDQNYNSLGTMLTITGLSISGEQGLLSMVFHPDYDNGGYFYVYYTNSAGNIQIDRYTVPNGTNAADPGSRVTVLVIPHPTNTNHNGGEMHFGPDGMLYITTGDGGGGGDPNNNAQDTTSLLGKLLRIQVEESSPYYSVPADNPYSNEIWSIGLRNPFRWSFDPANGDLWIGDVGQGAWEEVNKFSFAGSRDLNLGWSCYEGNVVYNNSRCIAEETYTFPVFVYPNSGGASVVGGEIYRGSRYGDIQGTYIAADWGSGNFYLITEDPPGTFNTVVKTGIMDDLVDFGRLENGEILAANLSTGSVYHLTTDVVLPLRFESFAGSRTGTDNQLKWSIADVENIRNITLEYSRDGKSFSPLYLSHDMSGDQYLHTGASASPAYYRLAAHEGSGELNYSSVVFLQQADSDRPVIHTSIMYADEVTVSNIRDGQQLSVYNINGGLVFSRTLQASPGRQSITTPGLAAGLYIAHLGNGSDQTIQKIIVP